MGGLMKITGLLKTLIILLLLISASSFLFARSLYDSEGNKKLDETKTHKVGNIWLRVSNYGFFGSGDNTPKWPSLEYPGGSGIDYLYQGALWFGAKKVRRNAAGQKLYWRSLNPVDEFDCVPQSDPEWNENMRLVIDTLVSVGFDGDRGLHELLPAYNPLEAAALGSQYNLNNPADTIMNQSIRRHRRGIDDDGDGMVDEDPVGYSFPFRAGDELPEVFQHYGGLKPHEFLEYNTIDEFIDIWFPLGFVDLSYEQKDDYLFTASYNDDGDGLIDEDGAPVSEQDFISYYYDYSPFPDGFTGMRHYGSYIGNNKHYPLNVRVRQMSYQWSFDYIKNLVYVEFNVTNMNEEDTLYDCAMGIYMDCDIGPQSWGASTIATDDMSGYVSGEGFEFAYSYDEDGDGGLTTGMIGARVCTPDPEQLEFACWFWEVGDGPDDFTPLDVTKQYANEKYMLITGKNPDNAGPGNYNQSGGRYTSLKQEDQSIAMDTRFLFGFYGAQPDMELAYNEQDENGIFINRWNLAPGRTMKIVVAVFPGDDLEDLKQTSVFAKDIYGEAQTLTTVVEPDIFPHYQAFEPPPIPNLHGKLVNDGKAIDIFWDNRSEIDNNDMQMISKELVGWQSTVPGIDSYKSAENLSINGVEIPPQFHWDVYNEGEENANAWVNPWTAHRLRHDFQGYSLWGRTRSGSQEAWMLHERWDKKDTPQDINDYSEINSDPGLEYYYTDFGGYLGIDTELPNKRIAVEEDTKYYKLDQYYRLIHFAVGDTIYGEAIYNADVVWTQDLFNTCMQNYDLNTKHGRDMCALLFKNPSIDDDIYLALYDEKLIPLPYFKGQWIYVGNAVNGVVDETSLMELRMDRLSRRYYHATIQNPPRGFEYYVAVSSWDRGVAAKNIAPLESGRDADANMKVFFPGPTAKSNMDNIFVTPNPYVLRGKYDGRIEGDEKGDKSRRIFFANLPEKCTIRIYNLAGDLIDTLHHDGTNNSQPIVTTSKASYEGMAASGIHPWNMLSRYNQIIAPGVYLYSVEDKDGNIKVNKFVIIK
jgi:hypothetical protein